MPNEKQIVNRADNIQPDSKLLENELVDLNKVEQAIKLFKMISENPFYLAQYEAKIRLYDQVVEEMLSRKHVPSLLELKRITEDLIQQIDIKRKLQNKFKLIPQEELSRLKNRIMVAQSLEEQWNIIHEEYHLLKQIKTVKVFRASQYIDYYQDVSNVVGPVLKKLNLDLNQLDLNNKDAVNKLCLENIAPIIDRLLKGIPLSVEREKQYENVKKFIKDPLSISSSCEFKFKDLAKLSEKILELVNQSRSRYADSKTMLVSLNQSLNRLIIELNKLIQSHDKMGYSGQDKLILEAAIESIAEYQQQFATIDAHKTFLSSLRHIIQNEYSNNNLENQLIQVSTGQNITDVNPINSDFRLNSRLVLDEWGNFTLRSLPFNFLPTREDMLSDRNFVSPSEKGNGRNVTWAKLGQYFVSFRPGGKGAFEFSISKIDSSTGLLTVIFEIRKQRWVGSLDFSQLFPLHLDEFYGSMTLIPFENKPTQKDLRFAAIFKKLVTAAFLGNAKQLKNVINEFNLLKAQDLLSQSAVLEDLIQNISPNSLRTMTEEEVKLANMINSSFVGKESEAMLKLLKTILDVNQLDSANAILTHFTELAESISQVSKGRNLYELVDFARQLCLIQDCHQFTPAQKNLARKLAYSINGIGIVLYNKAYISQLDQALESSTLSTPHPTISRFLTQYAPNKGKSMMSGLFNLFSSASNMDEGLFEETNTWKNEMFNTLKQYFQEPTELYSADLQTQQNLTL